VAADGGILKTSKVKAATNAKATMAHSSDSAKGSNPDPAALSVDNPSHSREALHSHRNTHRDTADHDTADHDTADHDTADHDTADHDTADYKPDTDPITLAASEKTQQHHDTLHISRPDHLASSKLGLGLPAANLGTTPVDSVANDARTPSVLANSTPGRSVDPVRSKLNSTSHV